MPAARPRVPDPEEWRRDGPPIILSMKLRVAGINFDHMHMGDLLRMVVEHPQVEIVGICDAEPTRMQMAIRNFRIPSERVFHDVDECIEKSRPDFVILCPATGRHAEYVE